MPRYTETDYGGVCSNERNSTRLEVQAVYRSRHCESLGR